MNRNIIVAAALVAVAVLGGYGLYELGVHRGLRTSSPETAAGSPQRVGDIDPTSGKTVLYWHDPMVPTQRFDKPGKSPFMDMQLVPVYADSAGGAPTVEVSPSVRQSLGVRTAVVERTAMTPRIEVVGNIAYNERDQVIVQARAAAFVEKLHVRATLDRVERDQPLVDLYVPAWVAAQEEFLAVASMRGADVATLVDAARQRMRQAGMTDEQIRRVEDEGQVAARITLHAPIAGAVVKLAAREGMAVMPGQTLFRLNGLDTVWATAEVPETQAAQLRPGAQVDARSPALPGVDFSGTVQAILPDVDPTTRTIKARIELANRERQLVPGMFVGISLAAATHETLTVPSEAVIATGRRIVVMRAEANGTFTPVDVAIGIETNGQTEITNGLAAGDRVVVSGQFLLDSEASLRATSMRMEAMPATERAQ